ncbi:MAG: phosphoenolpyruvate carboxykinase domain-containing protein, partial [Patescibacteria group bacterium]
HGRVGTKETSVGFIPNQKDLDMKDLAISKEALDELFAIDVPGWQAELQDIEKFLDQFGNRVPPQLRDECRSLSEKLSAK